MQHTLKRKLITDVTEQIAAQKRDDIMVFIAVFVIVLSLTPALILGGVTLGFAVILGIIAALTCGFVVVRWPIVGLFLVVGSVVLIEQNPRAYNIVTDHI